MSRDPLLLNEIIDAAERIIELVGRLDPDDAVANRDQIDALLWNFTVLGEAAGNLSTPFRVGHPEVPWADPVRLRNRIVHGYWSIELDVLLTTAHDDLPNLVNLVSACRADGVT